MAFWEFVPKNKPCPFWPAQVSASDDGAGTGGLLGFPYAVIKRTEHTEQPS